MCLEENTGSLRIRRKNPFSTQAIIFMYLHLFKWRKLTLLNNFCEGKLEEMSLTFVSTRLTASIKLSLLLQYEL